MTAEKLNTPSDHGSARVKSDFADWYVSDMPRCASTGVLSEYLVARALGYVGDRPRANTGFDMLSPSGERLAIKTAAYINSDDPLNPTAICFDLADSHKADQFIFCVYTGMTADRLLDLDLWDFFVLPASDVSGSPKLTYSRLLSMQPTRASYATLHKQVQNAPS